MALWTPAEIATQLWLDASDGATLTLSGSAVSQWVDKSGHDYHVSQATAGARPVRVISGQNGLSTIRFDGVDDRLVRPTAHDLGRNTAQQHIFVVRKFGSSPTTTQWFFSQYLGSSTASTAPFMGGGSVAGKSRSAARRVTTDSVAILDSSADATGFQIQSLHAVFSAGSAEQRLNAVVDGSGVVTTGVTPDEASQKFVLGSSSQENAFFFGGDLGEVVYCHNLATGDREKIEGYLAHKWGLASLLPADHPYKTAAPTTAETYYAYSAAPSPLAAPEVHASAVVRSRTAVPSPLGAPATVARGLFDVLAHAAAPSPLSTPAVVARQIYASRAAVPSPLGVPTSRAMVLTSARALVPSPLASPALAARVVRYELRGAVRVNGVLVDRLVRAHRLSDGAVLGEAMTAAGRYRCPVGFEAEECYVLPLDPAPAATDFAPPCANHVVAKLADDLAEIAV